jgi:hypothetical protein
MPIARLEGSENGGELFREREEPAVGGWLLITQSIDKTAGCKTSAGYASGEPRLVDFRKEAGDLTPTGALAGFAGIAYEHEKEVQTVAGGVDHAVRSTADHVAEDGQELEENSRGMSLRVRSERADDLTGKAVQGLLAQRELRGRLRRRWPRLLWWFRRRLRRVVA